MSSKKSPSSDDVDDEFDNEDGIDGGSNDDNNNTNQQEEVMMDMLSSIMQHQEQHQQAAASSSSSNSNNAAAAASSGQLSDSAAILQMLQQMNVREMEQGSDKKKPHTFWDTQPMLINTNDSGGSDKSKNKKTNAATKLITNANNANENGNNNSNNSNDNNRELQQQQQHGPIIPDKPKSELRQEPYNMPKGFEWSEVDISDPNQRTEVYDLLYNNYVEDDECMFRFDYSPEFLTWALTPPGYKKEYHLGVRSTKSNRLMALITGVPATVRVHDSTRHMVEVNYLCIHKRLRSKRLAPVLIKEITRRVNHMGVFQAVYTAGVVLPGHVASCRYYHRTLDARKLVDIGFTRLAPRMTMARMQKLYKLEKSTTLTTLRPMTLKDVPQAHLLVVKYLEKFKLSVVFSQEEFAHWLLPRKGVVSSFVNVTTRKKKKKKTKSVRGGNEEATTGGGKGKDDDDDEEEEEVVTDFCSYYHLHSSVLGNPKHTTLHAAYSFYNVANTVSLKELMRDCLILAKNEGHDVFNALNLMENEVFLSELKFGMGDGNLQYYVYNWLCPTMEHGDVGLVLL